MNSFFLHVTEGWAIPSHELIISAIFAGVFAGVGIGMIIRVGGTTAGSAILARIANKYFDWNISYALLTIYQTICVGTRRIDISVSGRKKYQVSRVNT